MPLSRRALLALLPAATAAANAAPAQARSAGRPAAAVAADHGRLLDNTVAVFAGTAESNARPEVAGKLSAMAATARRWLAALDTAGPDELFAGLPLGTNDAHLNASYLHLYEIALATVAPGDAAPDLRENAAVRRRVVDALGWLHERYLGDQAAGYYGNWFNWEIGIPTHVSRTAVLLADELAAQAPGLTATYVATLDAYLRNGKDGDVDLDSRFHTGANLADITVNRVLQGAVTGDEARIVQAVADLETVFPPIDPYRLRHGVTDGFYADGSFIQHASVAYTGSYGVSLLSRAVQAFKVLTGTAYLADEELVEVVRGWLVNSFAPVIFEGWLMELVRGRAVARTTSGYQAVAGVVEAAVDLSAAVTDPERARALRGYVRYLRETSPVPADPAGFVSPVSVARYAEILADEASPPADLGPAARNVAFNAMDRTVHRRPGYAFALSRSSARISRYEYMSGENLLPWFQGDGAHHLYLAGQDQTEAYGVDYLTTVSPYRLAGVTAPVEARASVPELYGGLWYDNPEAGFTSSSEAQNTYVYFPRGTNAHSGGASLDGYGAVGMTLADDVAWRDQRAGLLPADFVAYRNAAGTRSWFLLDDEVVLLAAGVRDPAGRAVTTTVDSRIAAADAEVSLTGRRPDGRPWAGPGPEQPLSWLRFADPRAGTAVGYAFLAPTRARVSWETVTSSRRVVRTGNPDSPVTRRVFSLLTERPAGAAAPGALACALVPHATEERLAGYAGGPLTVLANTARLQAVAHRELGLVAVNSFAPGRHRVGGMEISGAASVLRRAEPDGTLALAVADPTTERAQVTVVLPGRWLRPVAADEGVRVRRTPVGTLVEARTHRRYGASLVTRLR
ncbi:polysaccharide lyase family 8 super-sandwich domain-containing protein [Streptomyces sp. DSM 44915]|uniref:Polysaccharide lyase family 8 super-sandwich domain-containing protein n=1 Tax=Streptomyces chisholmiae TaxID=3075540 RepID=A0ABU2K0N5_9ACTN|nr:polysaccharide lyase family 8 super-sandwich domain-containing protein [Streptomyces sp. DSM 44915]MDT0270782.1 polysaccharide lyase family 8 super-sandwich domain-containing protein [Streptomyces sp. DSM 44915]